MWYQIASSVSNQRTKFVAFARQTCDFAPLTRRYRELQKGVFKTQNVQKTHKTQKDKKPVSQNNR